MSGQPTKCRYCRYIATKRRCHGKHFLAFYICSGAHWCHPANMTEPSVCGGGAALCQITLTACSLCLALVYSINAHWIICVFVCIVFDSGRCGGFMCVLFCKIKVAALLR